MKTKPVLFNRPNRLQRTILSASAASLFILTPCISHAAQDDLTFNAGAWALATNWSLGAIPGIGDNAVLVGTGAIDIRGSNAVFNPVAGLGTTQIQDLTFNSTAAVTLANASTSNNMLLVLNGGRGVGVPLISTVGNFAYTITGTGAGAKTLGLELRASGAIDIAANTTTISSVFTENGGAFGIEKTGAGTLVLSGANLNTGTTTVTAGILQVSNATALGSGPVIVNGGSLGPQNLTMANPVTFNGGSLLTRSGDLTNLSGPVAINGATNTILRSFSSGGDLNITVSGVFSGAAAFTIDGNLTNTTRAFILTNPLNTYSGTFNVNPGQTLSNAPAVTGRTIGTGTVNLNAGTLRLRDDSPVAYGNNVIVSTGAGTIDVDHVAANVGNTFDLGSLSIGAQTLNSTGASNYRVRFAGATTMTGAATFNPTTAPTVLGGVVSGGFDLTKTGSGTLQFDAANDYSGTTRINEGTLVLNGSIASSPRINVKSGATLDVTTTAGGFTLGGTQILSGDGAVTGAVTIASGGRVEGGDAFGAGTLTMTNLALGTALGNTATLVVAPSVSALPINVTFLDGLVTNGGPGKVTLNIGGGNPTTGIYKLVGYNNSVPIGDGNFALGTLPTPRLVATLQDSGTSIDLNVIGVDAPFWKGAPGTAWNNNPLSLNWGLNSGTGAPTDFRLNDSVTFDDDATITTVDVAATVAPSEMLFKNDTKPYTITGSSPIAGPTALTKTGAAKVTITNTNSFTGPVSVTGSGTLSVTSVSDTGSNSALGAGTTITLDGGTLEFTGASGSTNRPVTLGVSGGTVSADPLASTLTLTGIVSGTGLTKAGAGKVILTTATNTFTTTAITAGILQIGDGITNGTHGTGAITNDATLAFDNPLAQTVTNDILGTGALTKTGAGILVLSGAAANSYAGTTTVSGGNLILSKTSGVNAVGGNVIVETGGTVSYGTTGGQLQDHIPDNANITINGGTFGSGAGNTEAAPTAGVSDVVGSVTVNSGRFLSGRGAAGAPIPIPFTVSDTLGGSGLFKMTGGTALVSRGGGLTANAVEIASPAVLDMDGGSGTASNQSRLTVGAGGLKLTGATINFNAGPSIVGAASTGSVIDLNGNVTSTGTSTLARLNPTVSSAVVGLGAAVRTFDVTDTLTVSPDLGAVADLATGGILKDGTGKLVLEGAQSYLSLTNDEGRTDVLKTIGTGTSTVTANAGTINLGASSTFASITIADGAVVNLGLPFAAAPLAAAEVFALEGGNVGNAGVAAVPEPGSAALLLGGIATLLGLRQRRTKRAALRA